MDQRYTNTDGPTIAEPDESDAGVVRRTAEVMWRARLQNLSTASIRATGMTYSYRGKAVQLYITTEQVAEIGGAEVEVSTNIGWVLVDQFDVTGYEMMDVRTLSEDIGPRPRDNYEAGYYFDFVEQDPIQDDYIGDTHDGGTIANGGNDIWWWNGVYNDRVGDIYTEATEIPYLPPVIGPNTQTTLYKGTSTSITINGDYFAITDLLSTSGAGITLSNFSRTNPYTWTATATASLSAPPGTQDVYVIRAITNIWASASNKILIPAAFSASISGVGSIPSKSTYTWEAMPSSGVAPYRYSWSVYYPNSNYSASLGTAKTVSILANAGDQFNLTVTVRSSNGESVTTTLQVGNIN